MPNLRETTTAVIIRAERIRNAYTTEPYEAGWAGEAIVFLIGVDDGAKGTVRIQISPDGMNWVDEGTELDIPAKGDVSFCKLTHFGNWLRLESELPDGGESRLTATLQLKG